MALPGFTATASLYHPARGYRGRHETASAGVTPAATDFCDGRQWDANYGNPESCDSYISCDNAGIARVFPCPPGLEYTEDPRPWGHCDYPHLTNCTPG